MFGAHIIQNKDKSSLTKSPRLFPNMHLYLTLASTLASHCLSHGDTAKRKPAFWTD